MITIRHRTQLAEYTAQQVDGRASAVAEREADRQAAFKEWSAQKALLEAARTVLQHIDPPFAACPEAVSVSGSSPAQRAARDLWIEVSGHELMTQMIWPLVNANNRRTSDMYRGTHFVGTLHRLLLYINEGPERSQATNDGARPGITLNARLSLQALTSSNVAHFAEVVHDHCLKASVIVVRLWYEGWYSVESSRHEAAKRLGRLE